MDASVLLKAKRYCGYRERCHSEVRSKLLEWKVFGHDLEEVMVVLIEENYLNEERFAIQFASGKFHINKWGKRKIELELKYRKVSEYCIRKALSMIDKKEYLTTIRNIYLRKSKEKPDYSKFQLINYLIGKGFLMEEIEMADLNDE